MREPADYGAVQRRGRPFEWYRDDQLAAFHQQLTRHLERREVKKATASVGAPAVAVNR